MRYLGAPFDDGLNITAETLPDNRGGDFLDILDRVVQQCGGQDLRVGDIHLLGQDLGHRAGMQNIGVPGAPPLIIMRLRGEIESVPEHLLERPAADVGPHLVAVEF